MGGIFKAYDRRGSYPDEVDEVRARKIGAAFVALLNARRIVLGHDMRLSASALAKALLEEIIFSGAHVTDIGMTTTPMLYYPIIEERFDAGVMLTASHLSGGMNGFKLCRRGAIPLSGGHGLPAPERLVSETPSPEGHPAVGDSYQELDLLDKYSERLRGL
jgi:phosphomannomutase